MRRNDITLFRRYDTHAPRWLDNVFTPETVWRNRVEAQKRKPLRCNPSAEPSAEQYVFRTTHFVDYDPQQP